MVYVHDALLLLRERERLRTAAICDVEFEGYLHQEEIIYIRG